MGSEGTSVVTIHVTGFKKFHGVSVNPTEVIVGKLKEFMHTKGLPNGLVLGSCNILETAGLGQLTDLHKMLESTVTGRNNQSPGQVIWLHLGVNSGATRFAIENQAVNEATFRCPDELGWKPHKVPIIPSDGGITRTRETSLPVKQISKTLSKMGYDVTTSDDAGRFVCNYVYYQSLQFAEQHGIKSLFVHVPLFFTINEDTQMEFVGSLLEVLASLH